MDSGDLALAVDVSRDALWVAVKMSLPILISGMVVGALISILQAATQVQEQSLNQVPKMFTVALAIVAFMPWFLSVLGEYTQELVRDMGTWFR